MLPSGRDPKEVNAGFTPGVFSGPEPPLQDFHSASSNNKASALRRLGPVHLPSFPGIFFLSLCLSPSPPLSSPSRQPLLYLLQKENTLFTFPNFRHRNSLLTHCRSLHSTRYTPRPCINTGTRALQLQHTPQPQEWV